MLTREEIPQTLWRPMTDQVPVSTGENGPIASLLNIVAEVESLKLRWTHLPVKEIWELERRHAMPYYQIADAWSLMARNNIFTERTINLRITNFRNAMEQIYVALDHSLDELDEDGEAKRAEVLAAADNGLHRIRNLVEALDREFITPSMLNDNFSWRAP